MNPRAKLEPSEAHRPESHAAGQTSLPLPPRCLCPWPSPRDGAPSRNMLILSLPWALFNMKLILLSSGSSCEKQDWVCTLLAVCLKTMKSCL